MKKLIIVLLAVFTLSANAQEESAVPIDSIPSEIAKKIFIYNAAKQYNDPVVSRMAIYSLLAENPNNVSLRDSLALIYLQQQQYASAALVSQEVVSAVPEDMFATEIAAVSFERLGVQGKALNYYEKLYLNNTDEMNRLYKMAFLQLDLKLYEEATNSANQLMEHKLAGETTLVFTKDDGTNQEVGMKAAALRLQGMIAQSKGNKEEAKKYFKKALAEVPDFEMVKKQLAELEK